MAVIGLETMPIEDLDALSASIKADIDVLREKRRTIKAVRETKVLRENIAARITAAGLDGVVVVPETAHLNAEAH